MNKNTLLLSSLLFFSGCSSLGYYTSQGWGQMRLQWSGVKNEKMLKDPKVSEDVKHKIRLIETYKKFFYDYFGEKDSGIYSKTTMLEGEAVTYLVIASPRSEIKAHEFEFPFMGSFPYIGFFSENKARKFAKNLEQDKNLSTWVRPVYAYSTLGYFEDRILSSFFGYTDIELAELIFHELFHTVFFVKNEVDLNENLANYFGKELAREYFKNKSELKEYEDMLSKQKQIDQRFLELISILKDDFKKLGTFMTDEKADEVTKNFVDEILKPEIKKKCAQVGIPESNCEMKGDYNQARFAAFLTYEESQDEIGDLARTSKLNLKELLKLFNEAYKKYQDTDKEISFTDYIKTKVFHAPNITH